MSRASLFRSGVQFSSTPSSIEPRKQPLIQFYRSVATATESVAGYIPTSGDLIMCFSPGALLGSFPIPERTAKGSVSWSSLVFHALHSVIICSLLDVAQLASTCLHPTPVDWESSFCSKPQYLQFNRKPTRNPTKAENLTWWWWRCKKGGGVKKPPICKFPEPFYLFVFL